MMLYPGLGAVRRMIGARRGCIAFHGWMLPLSFSGSWLTATQTGPRTVLRRLATPRAQASPLPAAICAHEYGALKLIHGNRLCAASLRAIRIAPLTERPCQKVRCTPSCLCILRSHAVTSELEP